MRDVFQKVLVAILVSGVGFEGCGFQGFGSRRSRALAFGSRLEGFRARVGV